MILDYNDDFSLSAKDFNSCTHRQYNAQYLHSKFKSFRDSIVKTQTFIENFRNFKGNVSHPYNRGLREYYDYHWIGFADDRFNRIQDEVQLQTCITKDNISIGIFIDQAAINVRKKAALHIEKNIQLFFNIIKKLSDFSIGCHREGENDDDGYKCKNIDDRKIKQIISKIRGSGFHFSITKEISKIEAIKLKNKITIEVVYNWFLLKQLYNLLTFGRIDSDLPRVDILVHNKRERVSHRYKYFKLSDLISDETEAEATERAVQQISYEQNMMALENASLSHKKTVKILRQYLVNRGAKTQKSVAIDTLVEKKDCVFVFEVKSIHTNNFRFQTRHGIGQILEYEYFQIVKQ
ncbi:MAG: hypothetical protein PHG35_00890 [Dehalococcoidales bacterium]|nr:hypothetical protein [Dehalococcoidales bacterium]